MAVPSSDVVVAFGAVAASAGLSGFCAVKMVAGPGEFMTTLGFKDTGKDPVLSSVLQFCGACLGFAAAVMAYLLILACIHPGLWVTTVTFAMLFSLAMLSVPIYRKYIEDPAKSSEAIRQASAKSIQVNGAVLAFLLFAQFMLWWYSEAGTNYVHDATSGLPDELALVKSHAKQFLQHVHLGFGRA